MRYRDTRAVVNFVMAVGCFVQSFVVVSDALSNLAITVTTVRRANRTSSGSSGGVASSDNGEGGHGGSGGTHGRTIYANAKNVQHYRHLSVRKYTDITLRAAVT